MSSIKSFENLKAKLRQLGYSDNVDSHSAFTISCLLSDLQKISQAYRTTQSPPAFNPRMGINENAALPFKISSLPRLNEELYNQVFILQTQLNSREAELSQLKMKHSLEIETIQRDRDRFAAELNRLTSENAVLRAKTSELVENLALSSEKDAFRNLKRVEAQDMRRLISELKSSRLESVPQPQPTSGLEKTVNSLRSQLQELSIQNEEKSRENDLLMKEFSRLKGKVSYFEKLHRQLSDSEKQEEEYQNTIENLKEQLREARQTREIPAQKMYAKTDSNFHNSKRSVDRGSRPPAEQSKIQSDFLTSKPVSAFPTSLEIAMSENAKLIDLIGNLVSTREQFIEKLVNNKPSKPSDDLGLKMSFSNPLKDARSEVLDSVVKHGSSERLQPPSKENQIPGVQGAW